MDKESANNGTSSDGGAASSPNRNAVDTFADKFQILGDKDKNTASDLSNGVNLSDKIRHRISNYPHPVRTDPPLPHGFVEGALVGMGTYLLLRPIRSQAMRWASSSSPRMKPMVGMFITAGQVLACAQTALYSAVLVGSHAWLGILTDFAAAPNEGSSVSQTNLHKSLLADDLCREPIMQELLARPASALPLPVSNNNLAGTNNSNLAGSTENASGDSTTAVPFMEWVKNPKGVVTNELYHAVASCRNRQVTTKVTDEWTLANAISSSDDI